MHSIKYGDHYSSGYGTGYGTGYGSGHGPGDGSGYGSGHGFEFTYGTGSEYYNSVFGNGHGSGYSYGTGSDYGYGYGHSAGYGFIFSYADGSGEGYSQDTNIQRDMFTKAPLDPKRALTLPNAELRRIAIECMGPDRFFTESQTVIIDEDIDTQGNRRRLLDVKVLDTDWGYLRAVEVVCPTTGRVYYLGVEPTMSDCQEAVASTFGLEPDEYKPLRET